jgi:hypothetical protein
MLCNLCYHYNNCDIPKTSKIGVAFCTKFKYVKKLKKPDRLNTINNDDIINLKILLNTSKSFDEFINNI